MGEDTAFEEVNAVSYLYLRELSEPRDNSLRVVVQEAVVNRSVQVQPDFPMLPEIAKIPKDSWPIESNGNCKTFDLYWKRYAAYLVTEELVGSTAAGRYTDEVFSGKLLRVYSKSHFLDHLARDTGGHTEPIRHYKVICLNHLIDVAAYGPPQVRVTTGSAQSVRRH